MNRYLVIGLSLLTVVVVAPPASGAPQPVVQDTKQLASAPTEASALLLAKAQGKEVEVTGQRTETSTVFATPRGTMRMEQSLRPIRAKDAAGQWVKVDANLRRNADGSLSPIAATVPMTFSGGGAGPMASIAMNGKRVSIGWPERLPTPTISGSTATYPEVLPGVDLRITADVDSFNHILVVKNRQAAQNPRLARFDYPITTDGVTLSSPAAGVVVAKDAKGAEHLRGTASMWDTSPKPSKLAGDLAEPAEPNTRTVGLAVGKGKLSVIPDNALLNGPAERFPVYLDPSWTPTWPGRNSYMAVFSEQGGPLYNQTIYADDNGYKGEVKIGKTPAAVDNNFVARFMFQYNVSGIKYKHINRAWVSVNQLWSSSWCGDGGTRRTTLHHTNPYNGSTTWYNQPSWWDVWGYSDAKKFYNNSSCPSGHVEFNATGYIQAASSNGWNEAQLGLKAANEGDTLSWKRYQLSSMALNVEYNSYPNAPDDMWVDDKQCAAGQPIYTRDKQPKLVARVTDVDPGASMTAWAHWTLGGGDYVYQGGYTNGQYFNQRPNRQLADGTYTFRSNTHDGMDVSQWSGNCTFIVDTVGPESPSNVTSDIYQRKPLDYRRGVGRVGTFTFYPPADTSDVYGYRYGVDVSDISNTTFVLADAQKRATMQFLPMEAREYNLRVWAVDRVGNAKAPHDFTFGVSRGTGETGWWNFDGTDPLKDNTTNANNLVKSGDATFTVGRGGTGKALETFGTNGAAAATAGQAKGQNPDNPTIVQNFRTNTSYSVSAWAKLDRTGVYQTVASLGATRISAFHLQATDNSLWRMVVPTVDGDSPVSAVATSTSTVVTNRWTHVAGVYDATAKQVKIYVNGKLEHTASVSTVVDATGPVAISRGFWNGSQTNWIDGKVDDVRLWDRVISNDEVLNLAKPLSPGIALSANPVSFGSDQIVTFTAPGNDTNIVKYAYQIKGGPEQIVAPATPGGSKAVTLSGLVPGTYDVTAWSIDTVGNRSALFSRKDFRVRLAPKLTGIVYDSQTGNPAAGIAMNLSPGGYTTTTAADGTYTFTGMPSGRYTVSATLNGRPCGSFASTELDIIEPAMSDLILYPIADAFGYTCVEETRAFVDGSVLPATRIELTGDDASQSLALPFAFPFYGESYSTVYLSTNGVISFAPIDVNDSENHPVPSEVKPNGAIYPYWTDLLATPYPNSSFWTKQITDGGEQAFIIHFHGLRVYDQTPRVSFEVILYESGKIVMNYTKIDPASELERGNTATVGIESGDGMTGFLYSFNEAVLVDNHAIIFNPPAN